jgi:uncharacterized protein (DUF1330 family)
MYEDKMSVKVMGLIRLKDLAAFEVYRSQVGATVEQYGGVVLGRGVCDKIYWNELACGEFSAYVELEFPTAEAADHWANSPAYQTLVAVRAQAMDLTLFRVT